MRPLALVLLLTALLPAARALPPPDRIRAEAAKVDARLEEAWKAKGLQPNPVATDEVFLRRVYLDLAGRIPTVPEVRGFLSSTAPDRREALVRDLLDRDSYALHFFSYWADVLRFKSKYVNRANVIEAAFGRYIRESLQANKPYDAWVREMLSARGYAWDNPAIGYYQRDPDMPLDNLAITTRVFLGTRLECAQCHDHPFDKWKQTEFYRLAAFTHSNQSWWHEAFDGQRAAMRKLEEAIDQDYHRERKEAADGGKAAAARKAERIAALDNRGVAGVVKGPVGQLFSPIALRRNPESVLKLPKDFEEDDGKPGEVMPPRTPFGPAAAIQSGEDPALAFANWVTAPDNPRFARVIVNRLWSRLMGAPLTWGFDDLKDATEASLPGVEAELERVMRDLGYDLKAFLAVLAATRAYQAEASAGEAVTGAALPFTGPYLRRLTAEQAWDSLVALVNHEPDAPDEARRRAEDRRIQISRLALDAYKNFDGQALLDLAYRRLTDERELQKRELAVREELVQAKRANDGPRVQQLGRQLGEFARERGATLVRDFIRPMVEHLARTRPGGEAVLGEDPLHEMHPNPNILVSETWRKLHLTGYGPEPMTAAQRDEAARAEQARLRGLAARLGLPESEHEAFAAHQIRVAGEYRRAAEIESPAPRGHFLRTLGQSDRDFVENANPATTIPSALLLLNGSLHGGQALAAPHSPVMLALRGAGDARAEAEAAFLAVLTRRPTEAEIARWETARREEGQTPRDLVYALLNTRRFLFEE